MGRTCFPGGFLRSAAPLGCACGCTSQASAPRMYPWFWLEGTRLRQWGENRFAWARRCFVTASPRSRIPCHGFLSCDASSLYPQHLIELDFGLGLTFPGSAALPVHPRSYWGVSTCLPDPSLGRACSLPGSVLTPGEGRAPWSHLWPAGAHRAKVPGREHQTFVWTHISTVLPLKPPSVGP